MSEFTKDLDSNISTFNYKHNWPFSHFSFSTLENAITFCNRYYESYLESKSRQEEYKKNKELELKALGKPGILYTLPPSLFAKLKDYFTWK